MEFEHFDPREQTLADVPKIATLRELRDELAACKDRADREAAAAYDTAEFLLEAYMIQKASRHRLAREGVPSKWYYNLVAISQVLAAFAGVALVLAYQSIDAPTTASLGQLVEIGLDVLWSLPVVGAVALIVASAVTAGVASHRYRHELLETIELTAGELADARGESTVVADGGDGATKEDSG